MSKEEFRSGAANLAWDDGTIRSSFFKMAYLNRWNMSYAREEMIIGFIEEQVKAAKLELLERLEMKEQDIFKPGEGIFQDLHEAERGHNAAVKQFNAKLQAERTALTKEQE